MSVANELKCAVVRSAVQCRHRPALDGRCKCSAELPARSRKSRNFSPHKPCKLSNAGVMLSGVDKVTQEASTSSEVSQQEYCYRYQSELLARHFHARNKLTHEFVVFNWLRKISAAQTDFAIHLP